MPSKGPKKKKGNVGKTKKAGKHGGDITGVRGTKTKNRERAQPIVPKKADGVKGSACFSEEDIKAVHDILNTHGLHFTENDFGRVAMDYVNYVKSGLMTKDELIAFYLRYGNTLPRIHTGRDRTSYVYSPGSADTPLSDLVEPLTSLVLGPDNHVDDFSGDERDYEADRQRFEEQQSKAREEAKTKQKEERMIKRREEKKTHDQKLRQHIAETQRHGPVPDDTKQPKAGNKNKVSGESKQSMMPELHEQKFRQYTAKTPRNDPAPGDTKQPKVWDTSKVSGEKKQSVMPKMSWADVMDHELEAQMVYDGIATEDETNATLVLIKGELQKLPKSQTKKTTPKPRRSHGYQKYITNEMKQAAPTFTTTHSSDYAPTATQADASTTVQTTTQTRNNGYHISSTSDTHLAGAFNSYALKMHWCRDVAFNHALPLFREAFRRLRSGTQWDELVKIREEIKELYTNLYVHIVEHIPSELSIIFGYNSITLYGLQSAEKTEFGHYLRLDTKNSTIEEAPDATAKQLKVMKKLKAIITNNTHGDTKYEDIDDISRHLIAFSMLLKWEPVPIADVDEIYALVKKLRHGEYKCKSDLFEIVKRQSEFPTIALLKHIHSTIARGETKHEGHGTIFEQREWCNLFTENAKYIDAKQVGKWIQPLQKTRQQRMNTRKMQFPEMKVSDDDYNKLINLWESRTRELSRLSDSKRIEDLIASYNVQGISQLWRDMNAKLRNDFAELHNYAQGNKNSSSYQNLLQDRKTKMQQMKQLEVAWTQMYQPHRQQSISNARINHETKVRESEANKKLAAENLQRRGTRNTRANQLQLPNKVTREDLKVGNIVLAKVNVNDEIDIKDIKLPDDYGDFKQYSFVQIHKLNEDGSHQIQFYYHRNNNQWQLGLRNKKGKLVFKGKNIGPFLVDVTFVDDNIYRWDTVTDGLSQTLSDTVIHELITRMKTSKSSNSSKP